MSLFKYPDNNILNIILCREAMLRQFSVPGRCSEILMKDDGVNLVTLKWI